MKYRFINGHRREFRIATMCRVLCMARAGCYQWLYKLISNRAAEDQRLVGLIRDSYAASGGVYGALRVLGDVREAGEICGKHRVAKIMRASSIKAVRGYKRPAGSLAALRGFNPLFPPADYQYATCQP
ncbi:MAG: ISEc14 transposase [Bradyrhizobium sp.]|nr:ISEc14 transposase [Bradyrhizobium sp.]